MTFERREGEEGKGKGDVGVGEGEWDVGERGGRRGSGGVGVFVREWIRRKEAG